MADKPISAFTVLTSIDDADILTFLDSSNPNPATKNSIITKANFQSSLLVTSPVATSLVGGITAAHSLTSAGHTIFGNGSGASISTGTNNTYIGYNVAPIILGTNYSNTAVGSGAMSLATAGSGIIALGTNCLRSNQGNGNCAVGSSSGFAITSGYQNALFGTSCAQTATTMRNSCFFGVDACGLGNGVIACGFGQSVLRSNTAAYTCAFGAYSGYSHTSGAHCSYFGYRSGYTNSIGPELTLMGYLAGEYATGAYLTAFGSEAAKNLTDGGNVAVGHAAMKNAITAGESVAVGISALGGGTSFSRMTAVGRAAMVNATGERGCAFGWHTLYALTSGNGNNGVGEITLGSTTTADKNDGFGWQCLSQNVTGTRNCGFGAATLNASLSDDNAGFGTESLRFLSTGKQNSALGSGAGYTNILGDNCLYAGYHAGYLSLASQITAVGALSAVALTTGTPCDFFGYDAGSDAVAQTNISCMGNGSRIGAFGNDSYILGNLTQTVHVPGVALSVVNKIITPVIEEAVAGNGITFNLDGSTGQFYDYTGTWFSMSGSGIPDDGTNFYIPYSSSDGWYFGYGMGASDQMYFGTNGSETTITGDGQFKTEQLTLSVGVQVNELSIDPTLSGASNTALVTEGAIKSYVDGSTSGATLEVDYFTATAGQTLFTLSQAPGVGAIVWFVWEGQIRRQTVEYTVLGTTLTWLDTGGITIPVGAEIQVFYSFSAIGAGTQYWQRAATTVSPFNAGDNVTIGTGLLTVSTVKCATGATIDEFSTDNTLAGDSDTALATEKAIKYYIDNHAGTAQYWQRVGTNVSPFTSGDTVTIGNGLLTVSTVKGATGATINEFSTDTTLAGASDTAVPTENAVKVYVDSHGSGTRYIDIYNTDLTFMLAAVTVGGRIVFNASSIKNLILPLTSVQPVDVGGRWEVTNAGAYDVNIVTLGSDIVIGRGNSIIRPNETVIVTKQIAGVVNTYAVEGVNNNLVEDISFDLAAPGNGTTTMLLPSVFGTILSYKAILGSGTCDIQITIDGTIVDGNAINANTSLGIKPATGNNTYSPGSIIRVVVSNASSAFGLYVSLQTIRDI